MESDNTLYASPLAEALVELLGLPLAHRFVDAFAGQCLYIAKSSAKFTRTGGFNANEITKIIRAFGGETLAVPKTILPPKTTKPEIIKMAMENITSLGRPNVNAIARSTNTTHRWVRMVLTESRTINDDHPNLF